MMYKKISTALVFLVILSCTNNQNKTMSETTAETETVFKIDYEIGRAHV